MQKKYTRKYTKGKKRRTYRKKRVQGRRTRKRTGGGKYRPDEIYTLDELVAQTNNPNVDADRCLRILLDPRPSSKQKLNKCKNSFQVINTEKMNRIDYAKYIGLVDEFNQLNAGRFPDKKIEQIGVLYIINYIKELYGYGWYNKLKGRVEKNTPALVELLRSIHPYYYIFIMTSPQLDVGAKQWIQSTMFELFSLHNVGDLISLFSDFSPILTINPDNLATHNKYQDYTVTNVMPLLPNDRYNSPNKSYDISFQIYVDDFPKIYGMDLQEPPFHELYTDAFYRRYTTAIYSGGRIIYNTKDHDNENELSKYPKDAALTKNEENEKTSKINEITKANYNDFIRLLAGLPHSTSEEIAPGIEVTFSMIEHNTNVKRIIKLLPIMYDILRFATNMISIDLNESFGVFYPFYEVNDMAMCNTLITTANTEIFIKDAKVDEMISNFLKKILPKYDYNVYSGKTPDESNKYPRVRILDMDENKMINIACGTIKYGENKVTIGRFVQIVILGNIFAESVADITVDIQCLLIWEEIGTAVTSSLNASCPIFFKGVIEPIQQAFTSHIEPLQRMDTMFSQASWVPEEGHVGV